MKLLSLLLLIFLSTPALASDCFLNEETRDTVGNPEQDLQRWSLRKICFDNFFAPTKISTQDHLFEVLIYKVTGIEERTTGTGLRLFVVTAADPRNPDLWIETKVVKNIDGVPLSLWVVNSAGFELITGL